MIMYKALDGIWVRSKRTRIAYKVEAIKVRKNKITEVLIYNTPLCGFSELEWWDFKYFNLLTPLSIDIESTITISINKINMSDEKIIKLR